MKNRCLFFVCIVLLLSACKPNFSLNAPYIDVPVVYGILNYQDSIQYVKIYKGFQPDENGTAFMDAQNPDSIYYHNDIIVVLQEYDGDEKTQRPDIPLYITHDFPRDSGIFYYKDERIIYYTAESLDKSKTYNIKITNKFNGNITQGRTKIVGDFAIKNISTSLSMVSAKSSIDFSPAENASGYEIFVNFLYFEVDIKTNEVVKIGKVVKNISQRIDEELVINDYGELKKTFSTTYYDDISAQLKPNSNVVRYIGTPGSNGTCIEVVAWAAGESMVNFLISSKPTSNFIQINNIYTNLTSSEGKAFGFISSRIKCPNRYFATDTKSQDSLCFGSKTHHLSFRPWVEYKP